MNLADATVSRQIELDGTPDFTSRHPDNSEAPF
jgi:hypothetical protein